MHSFHSNLHEHTPAIRSISNDGKFVLCDHFHKYFTHFLTSDTKTGKDLAFIIQNVKIGLYGSGS